MSNKNVFKQALNGLLGKPTMQWQDIYVDKEHRFALLIDKSSGRGFLSIPVDNGMVTYDEYYVVDPKTFEGFRADPFKALPMADQARQRKLDHLLLFKPGPNRGEPI